MSTVAAVESKESETTSVVREVRTTSKTARRFIVITREYFGFKIPVRNIPPILIDIVINDEDEIRMCMADFTARGYTFEIGTINELIKKFKFIKPKFNDVDNYSQYLGSRLENLTRTFIDNIGEPIFCLLNKIRVLHKKGKLVSVGGIRLVDDVATPRTGLSFGHVERTAKVADIVNVYYNNYLSYMAASGRNDVMTMDAFARNCFSELTKYTMGFSDASDYNTVLPDYIASIATKDMQY